MLKNDGKNITGLLNKLQEIDEEISDSVGVEVEMLVTELAIEVSNSQEIELTRMKQKAMHY